MHLNYLVAGLATISLQTVFAVTFCEMVESEWLDKANELKIAQDNIVAAFKGRISMEQWRKSCDDPRFCRYNIPVPMNTPTTRNKELIYNELYSECETFAEHIIDRVFRSATHLSKLYDETTNPRGTVEETAEEMDRQIEVLLFLIERGAKIRNAFIKLDKCHSNIDSFHTVPLSDAVYKHTCRDDDKTEYTKSQLRQRKLLSELQKFQNSIVEPNDDIEDSAM